MKYTIKNLAKKFNISESGIRVAIYNRKTLPYEKIGSKIYIKEEDYISYKEKKVLNQYQKMKYLNGIMISV